MIVIFSDHTDQSTNEIIDWLHHFKAPFIRVNEDSFIDSYSMLVSNSDTSYTLTAGSAGGWAGGNTNVWYRRGGFKLTPQRITALDGFTSYEKKSLQAQLDLEVECATEAIGSVVFSGSINSPFENQLNKINVLRVAVECGLSIPETLITNERKEVLSFKRKHQTIITKNIAQGVYAKVSGASYGGFTTTCTSRFLNSLPTRFPSSLFQPLIPKWLDLRSFYLDGELFTSAIFSQVDKRTRIDFRNYNKERPNRCPPFRIPTEVKYKIRALMSSIGLRSGSIDMILTPSGEYVFLEVNPVGQFKQVSYPCNFKLEKRIAETLIHQHEKD